ncbi:hypothetical protein Val02_62810 [Virgisporangium aliadipatigenens]|uniref:PrgI family protein n=1 Tax=Virgisporangium aliadipatigenens TaxID=741659 RepID=A0A8J3YT05_9ACTN|nr:PrgI family protein [Virgisporangium aliadipatigenens]GIJ49395.1 hypothetical protein Val02_62810 [Virgisporangium aliadipatigenens]
MDNTRNDSEAPVRAKMSADVDAPDKVVYGLTFRQLAIVAVAAVAFCGLYQSLHRLVPLPVLIGIGVIGGGLAFGLAVGRRDGLALDVWLTHAVRHSRGPKALSATDVSTAEVPDWVEDPTPKRVPLPAPLRLPADAVADNGDITLGATTAAVVAASTVNLSLRTNGEKAALIDGFGAWLNSLSGPTQVVVSAQPQDLAAHAITLAEGAPALVHPALAAACADHAAFLADLATRRDPLRRQVLVVARTAPGERQDHAARRRAEDTVRQLSGLGVDAAPLDGAAVTAALAAAADPYRPPRPGGLAGPATTITRAPGPRRKESA